MTKLALAGVFLASFVLAVSRAPLAAADAPTQPDCVSQYVAAFMRDFPGFTIGDLQGHDGLPIQGYPFGYGGQAHYLQPFGDLLRLQATAAHDSCPFVLP